MEGTPLHTHAVKPWVGVDQNKRRMPLLSRHVGRLCVRAANDQDLEMSIGPSEIWFVDEENSFDTVDQVCWSLVDLSEFSTAASSPHHSVFEVGRPG